MHFPTELTPAAVCFIVAIAHETRGALGEMLISCHGRQSL